MSDNRDRHVGLCASCRWLQRVASVRDQQFYLCRRSVEDASFRKYPTLPVVHCRGWQPVDPDVAPVDVP